ncbi:unnamed protein product [Prunus armeniaca]|uniref:Uncharacterized protein n=1 Tax=Prunus armeniaca TaxID=36596 RepID=A0A6J5XWC2_PRUAR|nr:unnamed protein product [Prunus armeniaca]
MSLAEQDISLECTLAKLQAQIVREHNIRLAMSTPLPPLFSPISSAPSLPKVESPPVSPMAEEHANLVRPLGDFAVPQATGQPSCITYP